MKKIGLLVVVSAIVSFSALAGEFSSMNDTGEAAYGLRVVFSEPVRITAFGDNLTSRTTATASSSRIATRMAPRLRVLQ